MYKAFAWILNIVQYIRNRQSHGIGSTCTSSVLQSFSGIEIGNSLASASLWLTTMPLHKLQHGRVHEVRHLVHGAVTCACTVDTWPFSCMRRPVPPTAQRAFNPIETVKVRLLCSADLQKHWKHAMHAQPAGHAMMDPADQKGQQIRVRHPPGMTAGSAIHLVRLQCPAPA